MNIVRDAFVGSVTKTFFAGPDGRVSHFLILKVSGGVK
jgi:hypothetical protein